MCLSLTQDQLPYQNHILSLYIREMANIGLITNAESIRQDEGLQQSVLPHQTNSSALMETSRALLDK